MIKNLLILLLLVICGVYIYKYYSFEDHVLEMVNTVTLHDTVPVTRYRDSQGIEHGVIRDNVTDFSSREALRRSSFIRSYVEDTLAPALGISAAQLEGATTVSVASSDKKIAFLEKKVDSLQDISYFYQNKYLQLVVRTDSSTNGDFDYSYNADLNLVDYYKPRKVLGIPVGKDHYTDISLSDPNATIRGVSRFTIKQQEPVRVSFNASVQYLGGGGVSVGPILSVDLHPVILRTGLYYNVQQRAWQPSFSADYAIKSFSF